MTGPPGVTVVNVEVGVTVDTVVLMDTLKEEEEDEDGETVVVVVVMPEEMMEVVVVPVGQRGRTKVLVTPAETITVVCAAAALTSVASISAEAS
jgi:hypothetical protein